MKCWWREPAEPSSGVVFCYMADFYDYTATTVPRTRSAYVGSDPLWDKTFLVIAGVLLIYRACSKFSSANTNNCSCKKETDEKHKMLTIRPRKRACTWKRSQAVAHCMKTPRSLPSLRVCVFFLSLSFFLFVQRIFCESAGMKVYTMRERLRYTKLCEWKRYMKRIDKLCIRSGFNLHAQRGSARVVYHKATCTPSCLFRRGRK